MADAAVMKAEPVCYDDDDGDDEIALVAAATEPAVDDHRGEPSRDSTLRSDGGRSDAQANGQAVLSLLDKIIGVVDQIQQTQGGLEARQEAMERSVSAIRGELSKLSKSHLGTAGTVNKMLDKVRKVSVNVKTVRSELERQAGQIKKLESNEGELLKRRNFKVLIYQDQMKTPKPVKAKSAAEAVEGLEQIPEEAAEDGLQAGLSDEEVEGEKVIEESRSKKLQRSTKQRMETFQGQLEKTKLKTKENLEKTRQKTRDNLEKTKHTLEKKITKIGTRLTPTTERRAKMKSSKDKLKKSLTPDHAVKARSKSSVYRVPPFTFHVKKIREGEAEPTEATQHQTEMVEVLEKGVEENGLGPEAEEENGLGPEEEEEVEVEELVHLDTPDMVEALLEVTEVVTVEPGHHKK